MISSLSLGLLVLFGAAGAVRAQLVENPYEGAASRAAAVNPTLDPASQVNLVNKIMFAIDYRDSELPGAAPFVYLDYNGGEHAQAKMELGQAIYQNLPPDPLAAVGSVEGQRRLFSSIGQAIDRKRQETLQRLAPELEALARMEKADAQGETPELGRQERDRRLAQAMHYAWYGGEVKSVLQRFQDRIRAIRGTPLAAEASSALPASAGSWNQAAALAAADTGKGLDQELDRLADAGLSLRGSNPRARLWFARGLEKYAQENAQKLTPAQRARLARMARDLEDRPIRQGRLARLLGRGKPEAEEPGDELRRIGDRLEGKGGLK